jgi:hypothetical protein
MEKAVLFSKCSDQLSGPTRYQGFQGFSLPPRVQQLGHQNYCSPPPSAEERMNGVIPFLLNNQPDILIIQMYSVIKLYVFQASSLPIPTLLGSSHHKPA